MKIFLIGFMGCGKTTIGKQLAQDTGFDFVDTDRLIEKQQGLTISEIFEQHGEAYFRELERKMLLFLQSWNSSIVVATGGGMPCCGDNIDVMLACGKVAYLKTSPQKLAKRLIISQSERPLIKGKTETELKKYISEQLAIREKFYNRANITIET